MEVQRQEDGDVPASISDVHDDDDDDDDDAPAADDDAAAARLRIIAVLAVSGTSCITSRSA